MTGYDVVVIGAGAAGLSAGALLATEGKRVLVADRSPVLGGRPWRCRTRLQGQRRRPSHRRSRIRPDQGHQGPHRDPVLRARPLGRQEPAIDLFEFITVLECMTDQWWDHSASDNLYVRKMHFSERGTAAYSCWPGRAGTGCGPTCPTRSPPTAASCGSAPQWSASLSRTTRSRASR